MRANLNGWKGSTRAPITVSPKRKIVTTLEASKRGLLTKQPIDIRLGGGDGRKGLLPLPISVAQICKSGGKSTNHYLKSTIHYLEVSGLKLPQGAVFDTELQALAPEDVRTAR